MLIDSEVDFCAVQAGIYASPLHTVVMNVFGNHTNMNRKCPFPAGEYYVNDVNAQNVSFPSFVPVGRYLVNSTAYQQNNDWVYNLSIYLSVSHNYQMKGLQLG